MFGVPAKKYLELMKSIKIIEGSPWNDGEKGIMLSKNYAESMKAKVGDTLQFAISEGFASRIRAVPLTAIYEYSVENSILDKIVLTNPETVRAIMDMADLSSSDKIELSEDVEGLHGYILFLVCMFGVAVHFFSSAKLPAFFMLSKPYLDKIKAKTNIPEFPKRQAARLSEKTGFRHKTPP